MPDQPADLLSHDNESAIPAIEDPGLPPVKNSSFPGVNDELEIFCGPLLNFKGMQIVGSEIPVWHGSVLIVAKPGSVQPYLKLECLGVQSDFTLAKDVNESDNVRKGSTSNPPEARHSSDVSGVKLYSDSVKAFWRFAIDLTLQDDEARWQYALTNVKFAASESGTFPFRTFVVPSASQSMRVMFHSCNGFSVGTDEDEWSGPALWNDVLRMHAQKPFHVMVGGGDQIYNDGVRVDGPLKAWTDIGNPKKRRDHPFDEGLRAACDSYYFANYVKWFSTEPFASANSQIPQINIWDDHGKPIHFCISIMKLKEGLDTIDGFGSYTDNFMKCAVFRGIGSVSYKYYCLFQHHIPPPNKVSFTTPTTQKTKSRQDPVLPVETFVLEQQTEDSSFIIGERPGPYFSERSRSLYMRLGVNLSFLGVDARSERTRRRVNYSETYDNIFERVRSELSLRGKHEITHLLVLLGIPIAYPRFTWLENILTSPLIGPIRFLSKRFGVGGGFFNGFDGQVEILDDLDDHYTARRHRQERKDLLLRLQSLARDHNVRITFLGGDVHLAALGRFYSKPELGVPVEHDYRYMANVISSAITNKPPSEAIVDLLARKNRIHHLDHDTHETLMKMFDSALMMPRRNYAIISINPLESVALVHGNGHGTNIDDEPSSIPPRVRQSAKNGHFPLHHGEEGAGTENPAASGMGEGMLPGGLDVCFRVELDHRDKEGRTEGYGFSIPPLTPVQL